MFHESIYEKALLLEKNEFNLNGSISSSNKNHPLVNKKVKKLKYCEGYGGAPWGFFSSFSKCGQKKIPHVP